MKCPDCGGKMLPNGPAHKCQLCGLSRMSFSYLCDGCGECKK